MIKRLTLEEAKLYRKLEPGETTFALGFTLSDPDDNNFQEVTYYGESLKDITGVNSKPEWIYILANKYLPDILKIGFTTTSVYQRVKEINAPTGVVSKWFPIYSYRCANGYMLEQDIHNHLDSLGVRINPGREGFRIDIDYAIELIEMLGEKYRLHTS